MVGMNMLEKISSLAKRRGFIYPSSEIYGGIAGMWDYGPLGVELKRNLKAHFWKTMVQERDDVVGIDAAIFMNPKVWEASGHVEGFTDPLVECKKCKKRFRADHIIDGSERRPKAELKQFAKLVEEVHSTEEIKCPETGCSGVLSKPRQFNLMVEANLGAVEGEQQMAYLRGEITQGVHVNFKQVLGSTRVKIPFGIAQIGKAFRNEISPGQFTFRSREFEQMELQFYIKPEDKEGETWF